MASSVDIAPALGHGLITTQAGVAAGFDAIDDRRQWSVGRQEGVLSAAGWKVAQRAAGANMSVDVDADVDPALVKGDSVSNQGLYLVAPHTADINLDGIVAHASLPTIYTVVLDALDDTHAGGGLNKARARLIQGTPTAGATLDNRNGAPTLPSSALLLADILVAAADTSITNSEIRDRRRWATGARWFTMRTSNAGGGNDYTTSSTSLALIDSTNLYPRIECSGVPITVKLTGSKATATAFTSMMDGAAWPHSFSSFGLIWANTADEEGVNLESYGTPSAGSHRFGWGWRTNGATSSLYARSSDFAVFALVQEDLRANASND